MQGGYGMVAKELLNELENIRRDFDWTYEGRNRKIRGKLKSQPDGLLFDPIGAVCFSKAGLIFREDDWYRAAEEIGLSHIDAGDVTAAANNVSCQTLRRQIIDGLSLQPETVVQGENETLKALKGYLAALLGTNTSSERAHKHTM